MKSWKGGEEHGSEAIIHRTGSLGSSRSLSKAQLRTAGPGGASVSWASPSPPLPLCGPSFLWGQETWVGQTQRTVRQRSPTCLAPGTCFMDQGGVDGFGMTQAITFVLGLVAQLGPTLRHHGTVACQAPVSMGILQARIQEWIAILLFSHSIPPRD